MEALMNGHPMYDDDLSDDGFYYDDHGGPGAAPYTPTENHPHHASNHPSAATLGTAYALYRHGQDRQTDELVNRLAAAMDTRRAADDQRAAKLAAQIADRQVPPGAGKGGDLHGDVYVAGEAPIPYVNSADTVRDSMPVEWDDYIGQEPLKRQLAVHIAAAKARGERLPHVMLNSSSPGVGKTTMARLLAETMGVSIAEVVPPFNIYTLAEAGETLLDRDILFVDEIHLLKAQQQMLLKPLEDGVVHLPDGRVVRWRDITVVGATTEGNAMLDTILDRFKIKPDFTDYSIQDLAEIALVFADRQDCMNLVDDDMAYALARACQGTPRIIGEFVMAVRDLGYALGRAPSPAELLEFKKVTADGLSPQHVRYLTGIRTLFGRTKRREDGSEYREYVAGLRSLRTLMRERDDKGLFKIERFLITGGLVEYTAQGRKLTDAGIARAEQLIEEEP